MNNTPKIDSTIVQRLCIHKRDGSIQHMELIDAEVARKLQQERDEARKHLKEIEEYGTEEINAAVDLRRNLSQALVDLNNMQDQRDLAMKVIKRLEQERDEARHELRKKLWEALEGAK